jgi:hypothetical protein
VTDAMARGDMALFTHGWSDAERADPLSRFRDDSGELIESEEFHEWALLEATLQVTSR